MLTITDGYEKFTVTKAESLRLELKLNVSPFSDVWLALGNNLFDYSKGRYGDEYVLSVTSYQYNYLLYLHRLTD